MGHVTCGTCGRRCCWACDACPTCDACGPIGRGDYCQTCTARIRAAGGLWSEHHGDYIKPGPGDVTPGQPSLFPSLHDDDGRGFALRVKP